jgi:hypothetical protein
MTAELPINAVDASLEDPPRQEIVPAAKGLTPESRALVVQLQESQFQVRLTLAERRPRHIHRCMEAMVKMATMSEEVAASMSYAIPRSGKILEGPTIRFAEIAKQAWMHGDSSAHVVLINREAKHVLVYGVYLDLETNNGWEEPVQRSIQDRHGKFYSDDMINVTCNAACAIAKRNAILTGIPRAAWMPAWEAARRKAAGGVEGFAKKRQEVLKHFMQAGVAPDRVLATLGVRSEAALTGEHITSLRGMWSALQSGEATLDELFPPIKDLVPAAAAEPEEAQRKPRQTLEDLAEEEADTEAEDTARKVQEARERLLKQARDDGRLGFHKGLTSVPKRYMESAELEKAWKEEFEATKRETEAQAAEDDEGEYDGEV